MTALRKIALRNLLTEALSKEHLCKSSKQHSHPEERGILFGLSIKLQSHYRISFMLIAISLRETRVCAFLLNTLLLARVTRTHASRIENAFTTKQTTQSSRGTRDLVWVINQASFALSDYCNFFTKDSILQNG